MPRNRPDPDPAPAPDDGPSMEERVAGRHTLPPGSVQMPPERRFVNPYIARLAEYPGLILEGARAEAWRGRWRDVWAGGDGDGGAATAQRPLGVEIGSGNGFFLRGLCQRHPDRAFVGVEIRYKRVWMAARKLHEAGVGNGRVVLYHGGYLDRLFAPGEVDALYLNHPDPWPKERHARNRMITPAFGALVARLLAPGGRFELKSDCARYADDARRCLAGQPLRLDAYTPDLHRPGEPLAEANILTNYERKFVERGEPVFFMRWIRE